MGNLCVCVTLQKGAKPVPVPLQPSTSSTPSTIHNDSANRTKAYELQSHHQLSEKTSLSPSHEMNEYDENDKEITMNSSESEWNKYLTDNEKKENEDYDDNDANHDNHDNKEILRAQIESLPEPEQPQYNKTLTSDNEFENDEYPEDSESKLEDEFCGFNIVSKSYVHHVLSNEPIIFDSLLKADLDGTTSYKDVAGILVKNELYLISATNYKIWMELMGKTKMNELIQDSEMKINKKLAYQLMTRLNVIGDDQKRSELSDWFIGKTKNEIKLNIVLDIDNIITSLSFVVDMNINSNTQDLELEEIMQIELKSDHRVKALDINKSDHHNINMHQYKYGFYIRHKEKSQLCCLLNSNNTRYEWMTHLDYVIYPRCTSCINDEHKITQHHHTRHRRTSSSIMNDFRTTIDYEGIISSFEQEFTTHFNFGIYLNYWQKGYNESVRPKYPSLKDELIRNNVAEISRKQYYQLYTECADLMKKRGYKIKAHDIGVNNKKFNVLKGERITINHLIALKLYTDHGEIQRKFKKHCRKSKMNETMQEFITRNSEIAHWCRYLKESCTFFGDLVGRNDIFYTGLDTKLIFASMQQRFECPLSTTTQISIAQGFCNENGVILKVKASNSKTRCFDATWLSRHNERERIFMGASLQICDIYIDGESTQKYISAMRLFEAIMTGKFINEPAKETEETLYSLITVQKQSKPQYIESLFESMRETICKRKRIWINKNELKKIKHDNLRNLFNIDDDDNTFNKISVNLVQEFEWRIDGDEYDKFKNKKPKKCIESKQYDYSLMMDDKEDMIKFHLSCFSKYSAASPKCALFLHLDELPEYIEEIQIEYHLICDKQKLYKDWIAPQWLSKNKKSYCGFQVFHSKYLNDKEYIIWKLGIKVIDIIKKPTKPKCIRSSSESQVKITSSTQEMETLQSKQRSHSMDDIVKKKMNESIINLSTEQIIDLLNNTVFDKINNKKLNENKDKIISFFRDNKIDGNTFNSMKKKEFTDKIVEYHSNSKLRGPSRKVYIYFFDI